MLISSVWRGGSGWVFGLGLLTGGVTTSLLAVLIGSLVIRPWVPASIRSGAVVLVLLLALAHRLGILRLSMPQNARQVPERIGRLGPRAGALQFGFEMGSGTRTFITSPLPHVVLAAVAALAPLPAAIVAGLGFGLGRSLVPIARGVSGGDASWSDLFSSGEAVVQWTLTAAVMATAGVLSVVAVV